MTTAEKIRVMQAWENGRVIEFSPMPTSGTWTMMRKQYDSPEPVWNWGDTYFRIAEEN